MPNIPLDGWLGIPQHIVLTFEDAMPAPSPADAVVDRALKLVGRSYVSSSDPSACFNWSTFVREATGAALPLIPAGRDDFDAGLTVEDVAAQLRAAGFSPVPVTLARPGDVLLFGMPRAHAAVMVSEHTIAHCYSGRAAVETWLRPWWSERLVSAWRPSRDVADAALVAAARREALPLAEAA
jgi:cell wall-associated NlpC family hydrolase